MFLHCLFAHLDVDFVDDTLKLLSIMPCADIETTRDSTCRSWDGEGNFLHSIFQRYKTILYSQHPSAATPTSSNRIISLISLNGVL